MPTSRLLGLSLSILILAPVFSKSLLWGQEEGPDETAEITSVYQGFQRQENQPEPISPRMASPQPDQMPPKPYENVSVLSGKDCPDCPRGPPSPYSVEYWGSGDYPTVDVTGFFHLDTGWFHQDANNRLTVGDIQDGIGFRRARLAAKGNVTERTSYIIEMDFAASQPRFVDVWVDFAKTPYLGNIRIGRWRQPFGMAELTSIRALPFLERATMFALGPFRQTGLGFYDHADNDRATWAVSAVRFPTENFGNNTGDNGGYGLVGRATLLPLYIDNGDRLLHLGFDYSFLDPSRDMVGFANQPELQVGQSLGGLLHAPFVGIPPFVNTGLIPTRNVNLFGLEAAGALGRLYLQSEARWAVVERSNGQTETLPAAYVQVRYVLTGEKLPYETTSGVFGRIVPENDFDFHSGLGAWELAARWSYIDLNGNGFPGPGRRLNDLTFGLNWYVNAHTKFQFNYIHAFLDDPVFGDSDADIVALRTQLDF